MAAVLDDYLETTMDNDEIFPCKGCGEILEEGKAFELAGNRWHLDCFRCNTCSTLLDSDANLLLLGDGSLICNNCTYSCTACGNKIEDLAILTGDQAFCATCFRCRNCKRKIENLRYARTSQGIFCMSCHESLMARRKKKSRAAAQAKAREKEASPHVTEKSLPALPPSAIPPNAFASDRVEPESDTPTELSPRPRQAYSRNDESLSRGSSRPVVSPDPSATDSSLKDSLNIPSNNYRNNRNSHIFMPSDALSSDPETFFIPVALDPSPVISPAPKSTSDTKSASDKDYFSPGKASSPEVKVDSQASTPHIAFQEKGRQSSDQDSTKFRPPVRKSSKSSRTDSVGTAPRPPVSADDRPPRTSSKGAAPSEDFKLQDAPRGKKLQPSRAGSQSSGQEVDSPANVGNYGSDANTDNLQIHLEASSSTRPSSRDSRKRSGEQIRERSDSLRHEMSPLATKPVVRKEVPQSTSRGANKTQAAPASADETSKTNPSRQTYMQPRQAPPVPPGQTAAPPSVAPGKEGSADATSPKLRWSAGGEFTMDEDMARILGTDEGSSSILRRVSNAVRHGRNSESEFSQLQGRTGHTRSVSETTGATASPRWPRTPSGEDPVNGHSREISNPISITSPNQDRAFLKRQLKHSEQRVAELERQFNTEKDLVHLNKKLDEKRKTVSVLDTQAEIMIRQLEVLAGYVERAKQTKTPVDPRELEDSAIKEFVQKLERVKQSMVATIEQLHQERDQLVDEKNQAIADRDGALLEFEQLSSKNAQLADMNNDLTHQIQERFKSHMGSDPKAANGLGIYPLRGSSAATPAFGSDAVSISTATTMVPNDHEDPIVEAGPTVVNIRKGQVKKFNWKKGSKSLAQNVSKGVNRAVGAFQERERNPHNASGLSGDSIGLPYNMTVSQVDQMPSPLPQNGQGGGGGGHTPGGPRQPQGGADRHQGFGFFSKRGANPAPRSGSLTNVGIPPVPDASSTLFGSELSERADFERRQIPTVVTRCIEEVELRGMDVEGIYRKTGGNSLVKVLQEGFEKAEDYDISDPDIDITAVTSVLKQYFRKLPTPLLSFDIYDRILESNAIVNDTDRCEHLRQTFATLPQRHQDCLEFLMFHLTRVAQREPENLMSPKNLAVVFAPTIMRDHSLEREMTDMHSKNIAVQFIIENVDAIFID
ncbi:related to GTPase-activating protein beta-chimerin [Cephalotrichum gorgonifer]|uniref:Related to GTPase-activating protein beta-chimerin n=1 Tax=Cephalotrichum gorgonifer TaxID=2041049 RepID=A0AAE8N5V0_9PEZI|nr:related to GTPase-activating protein beta-chimerin [Cephalotrichum gorgonifer]